MATENPQLTSESLLPTSSLVIYLFLSVTFVSMRAQHTLFIFSVFTLLSVFFPKEPLLLLVDNNAKK